MSERAGGQPIDWYWIPIERQALAALCRRSDVRGALQTLGFLAILTCTGSLAYHSGIRWPWYVTALLLLLHGSCWAFLSNAFHEFSHGTVFASRFLNHFFLGVVSFLSWNNPVLFWTSHTEHHRFTLYPPDDLEIDLEARTSIGQFLRFAIVNPQGFLRTLYNSWRYGTGRIRGAREERLFPPASVELRRSLARWSLGVLAGHALLVAVALYFHLWMLPVVVTLAPFYGRGIQWLCNESQHMGLPGNVPDFRLCSRTVYLSPLLQFMYWHMNYHTDHHMYAAVPCYRLASLHRLIKADLPPCHRGLGSVWREIAATLRQRRLEPGFQFIAEVPPRRTRAPGARRPGS
ncbi:MAG TPA: fatty acid desaturase [Steroidobacteraceae bacterium]|nr:fatty acid desaturase [Steroidobacteraceae bacterium]